jgi:D-aminoacyl-tRNA deacylase
VIALIQRVTRASVTVHGRSIAEIERGVVALVGVRRGDGPAQAARLLERILTYRIFPDDAGRMNRSLADMRGGLLLVPQFTLAADTQKGTRASFSAAADPAVAERLFDTLLTLARERHPDVAAGKFGADMRVSLVNDGPVTFWLEA